MLIPAPDIHVRGKMRDEAVHEIKASSELFPHMQDRSEEAFLLLIFGYGLLKHKSTKGVIDYSLLVTGEEALITNNK